MGWRGKKKEKGKEEEKEAKEEVVGERVFDGGRDPLPYFARQAPDHSQHSIHLLCRIRVLG